MAQSVLNIAEAMKVWGTEYAIQVGLHKYSPAMTPNSHVFFVNGSSGSDSAENNGQTADTPLLTITAALGKCTHQAGDYIFVLDYYQAAGETWPIAITKQCVHIIGSSHRGCPWPWVQPTGDTAAFSFGSGSGYSEICGFELGGGANHGCIEATHAGIEGLYIHDNHFGSDFVGMTGGYGIYVPLAGAIMKGLIENNQFGGGLTSDGINLAGGISGCVIRKNHFRVDGIGINITIAKDFDDGGIFDNSFVMSSDASGKAITMVAGVTGGMIDGNVAGVASQEAPTNNPYKATTACGPAWGVNYKGGTALLAAADH